MRTLKGELFIKGSTTLPLRRRRRNFISGSLLKRTLVLSFPVGSGSDSRAFAIGSHGLISIHFSSRTVNLANK
jgi:hypothetical protein